MFKRESAAVSRKWKMLQLLKDVHMWTCDLQRKAVAAL